MCRVCLKRPEISDERYGRCESCARAGRIAFRFRLGPGRAAAVYAVKAGELSPRALRHRWREPLAAFKGQPSVRPYLGLHEIELITARDRRGSVRRAPDLAGKEADVRAAVREAAERSDASW
jgi:hypothetical protein